MKAKSRQCLLIVGIAAAAVAFFHAPLLQWLAEPLVAKDRAGKFQYVVVLGWYDAPDGDRCYDAAVELCRRQSPCGVLLVEPRPERLVEIGVLPSFESLSRRELRRAACRPMPFPSSAATDATFGPRPGRFGPGAPLDQRGLSFLLCAAFRGPPPVRVGYRARSGPGRERAGAGTARPPIRPNKLVDEPGRDQGVWRGMAQAAARLVCRRRSPAAASAKRGRLRSRISPGSCGDQPMSLRRRVVSGIVVLGVVLVVLWTVRAGPLRAMADFLDVGEHPRQSQYVMVLNGDENTRPFVAAALIKAGIARQALVAEVAPPRWRLMGFFRLGMKSTARCC